MKTKICDVVFIPVFARDGSSRGRQRIMAFERRSGLAWKLWYSWPPPALIHGDVELGGTSSGTLGNRELETHQ